MVNHLRNLLLNIDGSNSPGPDFPGEEYVPPGFLAQTVPTSFRSAYLALFPANADRALKNLRLRQYLAILHRSELAPYVTAHDPRLTYLPAGRTLFASLLPGAGATQLAGATRTLYLYGLDVPLRFQGRIRYEWRVEVVDGSNVRVRQFSESSQVVTEQTYPYTLTDGLSSRLFLPDTPLSFQFAEGVGSAWLVAALGRPVQELPDVLALLERVMDGDVADVLFGGPAESAQPYRACRRVWETHPQDLLRLAAVVLATAYRLHEARG